MSKSRFSIPTTLQGYQFKLQIPGLISGIYLQGTKFPGRRVNDISLDIGGSTVKYPGIPINDTTWTIKCYDDVNMTNRKTLDKMMGDTPFYMDKPRFQKKLDMTLFYGLQYENKLVLYGAYIANLGESTLDFSDHNPVQYEVTFNFQYWKFV